MASTLADLVLKISAQDTASATVNSMGAKIKTQLADIGKLAAGLALGNLGANELSLVANKLHQAATEIDTFGTAVRGVQVVTGASAESASALVATFEHFGLTGEDAASKLSRFERALSGTDSALDISASGGKRGQQILTELGVAYQDASGKILPMDQVLMNLAARWQSLDAASKNAAARGLFGGLGGQGAENLNLILDQGRAGLENLIATFQKEGLILSQENVNDVTKFTYAHVAMNDAFKGLAISLGVAFMPAITATAGVVAYLTQKVVQDLVPAIKGWPEWIGPATLAVTGLGIGMFILSTIIGPILVPFKALIGLVIAHGAASSTAAVQNAALAASQAASAVTAAVAAIPTTALAVAETAVGTSALVATGLVDQYGNAILRAAVSESAAGTAATAATPQLAAMGAAGAGALAPFLFLAGALLAVAAGAAAFAQIIAAPLELIRQMKAELANIPTDQMTPLQKQVAALINSVPTDVPDIGKAITDKLTPNIELPQSVKDEIAKLQADIDASIKANTPTIPTDGEAGAPSETALEAQAKAKKQAADQALKAIQDEATQRKDNFEIANRGLEITALQAKLDSDIASNAAELVGYKRKLEDLNNSSVQFAQKQLQLDQQDRQTQFEISQLGATTAAMQLKLTSDLADNNAQLLDYKRQIEDLDRNSVDFALKRQQLDEQDAVTIAKAAEDKLRGQADDLSYQEKFLIAQAKATMVAGGTVDTGALRNQIMGIRLAEIAGEPALLTAEHNTQLANRAQQGTGTQASLEQTQTERQKLALQEALKPYDDAAITAKRASDDAQTALSLAKQRFDLDEQNYKSALLNAQQQMNAIDQLKLHTQEAMKPWDDIATSAKRAAEDAQQAFDLEKAKFAIQEAQNADALATAQALAKAADEAYQKAIAVAQAAAGGPNAQGGVGNAPYGPLPNGVAGSGGSNSTATVNITNNNTVRSDADMQTIADKTTDQVMSNLVTAGRQTTNKPASSGLPGAYATSTP